MNKQLRSSLLLLLTAAIWGFAMPAQRAGSEFLSPMTFNALRTMLGFLVMLPLMLHQDKKDPAPFTKKDVLAGCVAGTVLFIAAFLQQAGVSVQPGAEEMQQAGEAVQNGTDAGKAGFITALYVVLVPVLGVFVRKKTGITTWLALLLAIPALYLLCMEPGKAFFLQASDGMLLVGAVFWAVHILVTDHFVQTVRPLRLCVVQFAVGAVLNGMFALFTESIATQDVIGGLWAVAYCGILSTGVGYTLQTIGQKECHPAVAALILCLESVFCVIGGELMLNEKMSTEGYIGCALMLGAVVLAQGSVLFTNRKADVHV